jgi:excisionase family DNA binding protein
MESQHYPASKFMTIDEAAAALNVSTKTIRRLIQRRLLRACKAVRKILIPTVDVESFIQRTC